MLIYLSLYLWVYYCSFIIFRITVDSEQSESSSKLTSPGLSVISEASEDCAETAANDHSSETNTVGTVHVL